MRFLVTVHFEHIDGTKTEVSETIDAVDIDRACEIGEELVKAAFPVKEIFLTEATFSS